MRVGGRGHRHSVYNASIHALLISNAILTHCHGSSDVSHPLIPFSKWFSPRWSFWSVYCLYSLLEFLQYKVRIWLCQFWLKIQPAIWFPLFSTGAGCEVRGVSKCLHKRYKAQCPNIVSIGDPQDCPDANKPYCCKFRWHESQDQALATVTHVMKPNIAVKVTSVCIVP